MRPLVPVVVLFSFFFLLLSAPSAAACETDDDCPASIACTVGRCPTPGGECVVVRDPDCCVPSGCPPHNACEVGECVRGTCRYTWMRGCCLDDRDCGAHRRCSANRCQWTERGHDHDPPSRHRPRVEGDLESDVL